MKYQIQNNKLEIKVEGEKAFGEDRVLFQEDDNLIARTDWQKQGYTLLPLFEQPAFDAFILGLQQVLIKVMQETGLEVADKSDLTQYHRLLEQHPDFHLKIVNRAKILDYSCFPIPVAELISRVEDEVKTPLTVLNPYNQEYIFSFRIVRPGRSDFNPLHRDAWHTELKGCLNLYIPVVGSNEHSSLCLIPSSHFWTEAEVERTQKGAIMNDNQYTVPGLTHTNKPLHLIRPNPTQNKVLLFTPYLIHGGAANLNPDTTRISVEIRFWRK